MVLWSTEIQYYFRYENFVPRDNSSSNHVIPSITTNDLPPSTTSWHTRYKVLHQRAIRARLDQVNADPSSRGLFVRTWFGNADPEVSKGLFVRDWSKHCRPLVRGLSCETCLSNADPFVSIFPLGKVQGSWYTRFKVLHYKRTICASLEQALQTPP
jgi:hypothetical protein